MHAKPEIQGAIAALVDDLTAGLVIMPDVFCARPSRNNLFVGGAKLVPTIYGPRYADAGGLLAYGPDFVDEHRRPASYLDRIHFGQKTLPIQTPTKFEFAINLKAAKALISITVCLAGRAGEKIRIVSVLLRCIGLFLALGGKSLRRNNFGSSR